MALIVQKFGGSSVKDRDRIFNVARIVANTHNAGNDVVVVVSAQGDTTDDLITKAAEITHNPSAREMDMLLAAGEEISIALLAMALNELGCHATSLTGWQAGFRTDRAYTKARITKLETERISSELERNRVVVVAGFQGLNKLDDITTLGRGGSDTSAVAIAAALHADRCQIFTDVEGVYTADPRKVRNTRKLDEITFDEMLELASLGAQVLNNRSVELAKKYNVELEVLSSLNPVPGTVVKEVVKDVEGMLIKGVAKDTDVAVITILNVPDEPGTSFKIFGLLAQKNINVDIILQSTGRDGKKDISFTCSEGEGDLAMRVLKESAHFHDVSVVGAMAISGLALTFPLMNLAAAFGSLVGVGASTLVSVKLGQKDYEGANRVLGNVLVLNVVLGLAFTLAFMMFLDPILYFFGASENTIGYARDYMKVILMGNVVTHMYLGLNSVLRSSGFPKMAMYATLASVVINCVLNPLFIFGFGWGTVGAALATWLAEATVFGIFIYKLRYKDDLLGGFPFLTRLKKKYTRRIFKLGLPVATLNTLFAFVNMFLSRTASEQGGHIGLMAFTTGGQIEAITWNTSQGFSTGLSTFIAQNYAAGEKSRVKKAWYTTLWMTSIFGTLCSLLFIFFGSEVFSIFVPEPEAFRVGGDFLRIDGYSQLFMMLEITMQGVFYGLGRTIPPAIISISCNYMRIPVALFLVHMGMGVDAIWWAVSATTIAKGIILTAWFILIKRKIL